jgi:cytidylate kinase
MYRAVTWVALQRQLEISDEAAITRLAEELSIDVQPPSRADGRACDVIADGQDVTWETRRPEVDANVSPVSVYAGVRAALTAQQRRIGLRGNVVMVGRDIGTVVLPEADLKIYLVASAQERARRRYTELLGRGEPADYDQILAVILRRDRIDSTRQVAPLRAAQDAIVVNSDELDADQVLQHVQMLVDHAGRTEG